MLIKPNIRKKRKQERDIQRGFQPSWKPRRRSRCPKSSGCEGSSDQHPMCFSGRKVGLALSQVAQELRRVLHRLLDQFGYGLLLRPDRVFCKRFDQTAIILCLGCVNR